MMLARFVGADASSWRLRWPTRHVQYGMKHVDYEGIFVCLLVPRAAMNETGRTGRSHCTTDSQKASATWDADAGSGICIVWAHQTMHSARSGMVAQPGTCLVVVRALARARQFRFTSVRVGAASECEMPGTRPARTHRHASGAS